MGQWPHAHVTSDNMLGVEASNAVRQSQVTQHIVVRGLGVNYHNNNLFTDNKYPHSFKSKIIIFINEYLSNIIIC